MIFEQEEFRLINGIGFQGKANVPETITLAVVQMYRDGGFDRLREHDPCAVGLCPGHAKAW